MNPNEMFRMSTQVSFMEGIKGKIWESIITEVVADFQKEENLELSVLILEAKVAFFIPRERNRNIHKIYTEVCSNYSKENKWASCIPYFIINTSWFLLCTRDRRVLYWGKMEKQLTTINQMIYIDHLWHDMTSCVP